MVVSYRNVDTYTAEGVRKLNYIYQLHLFATRIVIDIMIRINDCCAGSCKLTIHQLLHDNI
jgi:hypothetical protein